MQVLDGDVVCIDALYTALDVACCYLVGDGDEYAFIETGTNRSVPNILATLHELGVDVSQLRYIIPTHVHLDHAGGCGQLMALCPNATLLIHPRGARHMIDPQRLVDASRQVYGDAVFERLYGDIVPVSGTRVRELADGDTVELGQRRLRTLHTRGHAEHHFCLFDERSGGWFSGDMFGISYPFMRLERGAFVMPATTPTQFDPALYAASVRALADANPAALYLTHFSALHFDPAQADMLCRQLEAYASLAESEVDDVAALTAAVAKLAVDEAARLADSATAASVGKQLQMDVALNAQGIIAYRQRVRRAASRSAET